MHCKRLPEQYTNNKMTWCAFECWKLMLSMPGKLMLSMPGLGYSKLFLFYLCISKYYYKSTLIAFDQTIYICLLYIFLFKYDVLIILHHMCGGRTLFKANSSLTGKLFNLDNFQALILSLHFIANLSFIQITIIINFLWKQWKVINNFL